MHISHYIGKTWPRRFTTEDFRYSQVFKIHVCSADKITVHFDRNTPIGKMFLDASGDAAAKFKYELISDFGVSEVKFAPN